MGSSIAGESTASPVGGTVSASSVRRPARGGSPRRGVSEREIGLVLSLRGACASTTASVTAVGIGAVTAGLDGYEEAIEDIELDLLQCLTPTEGVPPEWLPKMAPNLTVGAPEPVPPGEGLPAATVLIPIHIITFVDSIDY